MGHVAKIRLSLQRRTELATAEAIAAGESDAKFQVCNKSSFAKVADSIVHPILLAVATSAATGPATSDQHERLASVDFQGGLFECGLHVGDRKHDSHTARAQYLKGPSWAANAGSSLPEAPSIT